ESGYQGVEAEPISGVAPFTIHPYFHEMNQKRVARFSTLYVERPGKRVARLSATFAVLIPTTGIKRFRDDRVTRANTFQYRMGVRKSVVVGCSHHLVYLCRTYHL